MQRYAACIIAAIVIAGSITGLRPAAASTYEPPLSIPNATTVKAEHGIPDKPTAEGYWDHDWPPPGEQSNLSAFIVNNQDQSVPFMLVFQISYIDNVTQSIEWRADELEAGESKVVSVPWTPDHPGHFEIDILQSLNWKNLHLYLMPHYTRLIRDRESLDRYTIFFPT